MQRKNVLFLTLVGLVSLDISLTCFFVIFYDAIEINPLCVGFLSFMIIKIIISAILLYIAYKIKNTPLWSIFIVLLIGVYSSVLYFNLCNVVNYFF